MTVPEFPTVDEMVDLLDRKAGFEIESEFGCWLWRYTPSSYGPVLAAFESRYGPLPDGMRIFHRCPNGRRGCIRPGHLDALPDDVAIPDPPLSGFERESFARRLSDEREARRFTLAAMARYLKVSSTTLSNWERGVSVPSPDLVRQLGVRLGWDNKPRRWLITAVVQRVVVERSAGGAVRAVFSDLERDGQALKAEIRDVRKLY